jgi:hypothetical protein
MLNSDRKSRRIRRLRRLPILLLVVTCATCNYGQDAYLGGVEERVKTLASRINSEFEEMRLVVEGLASSIGGHYERREEIIPTVDKTRYRTTGNGCLYRVIDDGQSALWVSGIVPVDEKIREVAYLTEPIEEEFAAICEESSAVLQVYYNDKNSLHRIYPSLDVLSHYRSGMNIPKLPSYYLADGNHNPDRGGVWVNRPFVDSLRREWIVSAIAPVYEGDELLGVPGLDVMVRTVLNRVIAKGGRRLMIVDSSGMLVAVGEYVVDLLGLPPLKEHCYFATVMDEAFLRDKYNVLECRYPSAGEGVRLLLEGGRGRAECDVNGRKFFLICAPIPELAWKLIQVEG